MLRKGGRSITCRNFVEIKCCKKTALQMVRVQKWDLPKEWTPVYWTHGGLLTARYWSQLLGTPPSTMHLLDIWREISSIIMLQRDVGWWHPVNKIVSTSHTPFRKYLIRCKITYRTLDTFWHQNHPNQISHKISDYSSIKQGKPFSNPCLMNLFLAAWVKKNILILIGW